MRVALRAMLALVLTLVVTGPAAATHDGGALPPGCRWVRGTDTPDNHDDDVYACPRSVVSFIDSGINPYHEVFRDDGYWAYQHPSTYIPGYPADAVALPITLPPVGEQADWAELVQEDCEVWKTVQSGKLYWFPGTRIIGGISFDPWIEPFSGCSNLPTTGTEILDYGGHGTMVASRGASSQYGACLAADCRIVSVQYSGTVHTSSPATSTTEAVAAVRWAADNSTWIDVQSNSWGPLVPLWEPTGQAGLLTANPELVRAVEYASSRHAAFWASGNGAGFRVGVLGHPTLLVPHLSAAGYMVGGHDSGYMNVWPGFSPHIVADSCAAWGAVQTSINQSGDTVSGGTSGATPFVAGGAGALLLEARRLLADLDTGVAGNVVASGDAGLVPSGPLADGMFTEDELRAVLLKTATARPGVQWEDGPVCTDPATAPAPVKWTDVAPGYPEFIQIGYGAVDRVAQGLALRVLKGEVSLPDRATTDQYFAVDDQVRRTLYPVWSGGGAARR